MARNSARVNSQLNLPPMPLVNQTQDEAVRPKYTQGDDPRAIAAEVFDSALTAANISTADVASRFRVSESLVRRMRSRDARECVSNVQMLLLPPSFHVEYFRAMNKRFGLGRALLNRLMDAAADLALVVEG